MLKSAYLETTSYQINKLIANGRFKFLAYSNYTIYNHVELFKDDKREIQQVSVDEHGNILGYFSVSVSNSQRKIIGSYFVKFKYLYESYATSNLIDCGHWKESSQYKDRHREQCEEMEAIAKKDFIKFIDVVMNHPLYDRMEMSAVSENPANRVYEKWMELYGGERFLYRDYIMLQDGEYYDVYFYWFNWRKS